MCPCGCGEGRLVGENHRRDAPVGSRCAVEAGLTHPPLEVHLSGRHGTLPHRLGDPAFGGGPGPRRSARAFPNYTAFPGRVLALRWRPTTKWRNIMNETHYDTIGPVSTRLGV